MSITRRARAAHEYRSATPLFDLNPPAPVVVPPVDPNVRPQDALRLSKNNRAVLDRLQQGPATTLELMGDNLGGIRPGARVFDLGKAGVIIKSERVKRGIARYTLIRCPEELL